MCVLNILRWIMFHVVNKTFKINQIFYKKVNYIFMDNEAELIRVGCLFDVFLNVLKIRVVGCKYNFLKNNF